MKRFLAIVSIAALVLFVIVYSGGDDKSPGLTKLDETKSTAVDATVESSPELSAPVAALPDDPAESIECDLTQLQELQQFNRSNLRRLERSRLEPEAIAAYRGMKLNELKALFEQDDSLAMIVYGMHFLFGAMGMNPGVAVDYLYHQMPIREIAPNPTGVPDNAAQFAREARRAFTEAAMRGRHAAFTFIGLTYVAEGKNAVDLAWMTQEAYDSLTEEQKFNVEPRIAYSHLAYRMDANLLPVGSPNRKMFDDNLAALGEHGDFLEFLEMQFRQQLSARGLTFPTVPEVYYPDVDAAVIEACEDEGFSQWD